MPNLRSIIPALRNTGMFATLTLLPAANLASAEAEPVDKQPEEKALRIVPLVTSTPLTGTGAGFSASYLYRLDDDSSKSQLQVGGQYSNTDSVSLFLRNNAFLRGNDIVSTTALLPAKTNSEFDGDLPTLSGKSILRGFPAGQFRARFMNGAQTEYRYVLEGTAYKFIAFAGVARLHGVSLDDV